MNNELIRSLDRRDAGTHVDKLGSDPEMSTLFTGYMESVSSAFPGAQALLEKHKNGTELDATERRSLSDHMARFDARLQRAESVLRGLEASDISALSEILRNSVPLLSGEALPLYLKGLAVRSEPSFDIVVARINDWKGAARSRIENRKATRYSNRLTHLCQRYNIDQAERERLMNLTPSDRQRELQSILGNERVWEKLFDAGNFKRFFATVTRGHWESREEQLVRIMEQYDRSTEGIQRARAQVVGVLNSIDTSSGTFWSQIPALLRQRKEAPRPAGSERLSLGDAQKLVGKDSVKESFERHLKARGGDAAINAWRAVQRQVESGSLAASDAYNQTFTATGGAAESFDSVFSQTSSEIESHFARRGFLNYLLELLFGRPLRDREIDRSKNAITNIHA